MSAEPLYGWAIWPASDACQLRQALLSAGRGGAIAILEQFNVGPVYANAWAVDGAHLRSGPCASLEEARAWAEIASGWRDARFADPAPPATGEPA